jgi:phage shock protein PspC (stress-responsive transcriptional regulator)
MKKTITITLGGRSFVIEEDAYRVLDAYLSGLRRRFSKDASLEELMEDIESGVGEKFAERLDKHKTVITEADVDAVVAVMGKADEIAYDDADASSSDGKKEEARKETSQSHAPRRLYRDPDDVVIGGVCSGLAAYFGLDPVVVRVLFVLLAFANGIGVLAYIVLWISVPSAENSAQKLEMRGKPVNLSEIQEMVKEKAKVVETEGRSAWNKMKEKAEKMDYTPVNTAASRAGGAVVTVINGLFAVICGMIGVLLSIAAGLAMAGLTAVTALLLISPGSPSIVSDLPLGELAGNWRYYVTIVAGYFAVLFPLVFVSLLGSAFIRRKNAFRTGPVIAMSVLWFAALSVGFAAGTDLSPWVNERLEEAQTAQTVTRDVDQKDFRRIVAGDAVDLRIVRGEAYKLTFTGREADLNDLHADVRDGALLISQDNRRWHGICIFCTSRRVTGEITLPSLEQYEGDDASRAQLSGFTEDIVFLMDDASRAEVEMSGQHVTSTVRDVARLIMTGSADSLYGRVEDAARLDARDMQTERVTVKTEGVGRALVWPTESLDAFAVDASRVVYVGDTATSTIRTSDMGRVSEGLDEE